MKQNSIALAVNRNCRDTVPATDAEVMFVVNQLKSTKHHTTHQSFFIAADKMVTMDEGKARQMRNRAATMKAREEMRYG